MTYDSKNKEALTASVTTAMARASEKYLEAIGIRALVQVIPYVGSPLDTLLSGKGSAIQRKRIETFLQELDSRLKQIEKAVNFEPDEHFYDFMVTVIEAVTRSSSQKIKHFASLVKNQVIERKQWEDVDSVAHLLSDLSDLHISVLIAIMKAPPTAPPFFKIVSLYREAQDAIRRSRATALIDQFPDYNVLTLQMICADLISKGLVRDEGVRRLDAEPMQFFEATELAELLIGWLEDK